MAWGSVREVVARRANDLSRCINRATGQIDMTCVATTFRQAPANLAAILARLRAAAGPRVPIVGMNFYEPFLAAWLRGPAGQALARLSVQLVTQYNDLLEAVYQDAGVPVADVQDAFATTNFDDLVTLPDVGPVPLNVARICQWTWRAAAGGSSGTWSTSDTPAPGSRPT